MPHKLSLWLGSQASYETSVEAASKVEARMNSGEEPTSLPPLLEIQGNVGVINVSGSLIPGNAGWGLYYGQCGYGDIRDALTAALLSAEVTSILLNVSSGGGAVAGCLETAQLVQRVDKVKPVVTYAGATMASAALWIGVSARKVFGAQTAEIGSLGIIMVHADKTAMLEQAGIKVTVIRAGTDKALATPYEALSDKAKAGLQARADSMYTIFLDHVAACRGVPSTTADKNFGQGVDFLGAEALKAGLIDQVGTFEDAYSAAMKLGARKAKPVAATTGLYGSSNNKAVQAQVGGGVTALADNLDNPQGTHMPKPLSQEQIDAMAAGVELPEAAAERSQAEIDAEAAALAATASAAATSAAVTTQVPTPDALTVLQGMLATAQADVMAARMEAVTAKTESEKLKPQVDGLLQIARASVKTMGLHFGMSAESAAALAPEDVLAEHARLSALFQSKFKVGGVAATTTESTAAKVAVNPMFLAVVASTQKAK